MDQIANEVRVLEREGHKRLLMLCGEHPSRSCLDYFIEAIETAYGVKTEKGGEIRRINVEIAPLSVAEFRRLKATKIGTYVLFQETYHHETYRQMHPPGPKADFAWRVTAMHRAQEGGIDDVGLGALFGLYDYKYEVVALLFHALQLEKDCGVGPHTISIPRLKPAMNAPAAIHPPAPVSDHDFKKLVAILRLAVPYTGIILTTRETPALRNEVFNLGVSQISAGSRTNPGGYQEDSSEGFRAGQFNLGDTRTPGRGDPRHHRDGSHPELLYGLLPPRADGPGLHGPGETRTDPEVLPDECHPDLQGIPPRLRLRRDTGGRREPDRPTGRGDGVGRDARNLARAARAGWRRAEGPVRLI